MRVLGIDPGNSGAVVVLEDDQPIEWMRMPVHEVGKSTRVNAAALSDWIKHLNVGCAYVEKVGAMPGQGVSSMFTFGHAAGTVMGILGALEIPYVLVSPREWKKNAGLIGSGKDASRSLAITIWPQWRAMDKKISGQAYADAALIARFGEK